MTNKKDEVIKSTADEVITGVLDGKELTDESIKNVAGGVAQNEIVCRGY